jgi:hypothetical protein
VALTLYSLRLRSLRWGCEAKVPVSAAALGRPPCGEAPLRALSQFSFASCSFCWSSFLPPLSGCV